MKRIGVAASKMAKGNMVLYNSYVVLISFLFSVFIFVVAGATLLFALLTIVSLASGDLGKELRQQWFFIFTVCMASLTIIIFIFNLIAISTNMKWQNPTDEK